MALERFGLEFVVKDSSGSGARSALTSIRQMNVELTSVKRLVGTAFGVTAGYLGVRGLVEGFKSVTRAAMEATESENLFTVSMGKQASAAREWSTSVSQAMGVSEYAARRNVATLKTMLDSMGLTEAESLSVGEAMTTLAYDMASFYNLRPDEAFQKIQSGLSGEVEPLKRLGIVINETSVQEYALRQGWLKQGETLSEVGKIYARVGLIMERTKAAQGDMIRTAGSPANTVRRFYETLEQVKVGIGKNFLPTVAKTYETMGTYLRTNQQDLANWAAGTVNTLGSVVNAYLWAQQAYADLLEKSALRGEAEKAARDRYRLAFPNDTEAFKEKFKSAGFGGGFLTVPPLYPLEYKKIEDQLMREQLSVLDDRENWRKEIAMGQRAITGTYDVPEMAPPAGTQMVKATDEATKAIDRMTRSREQAWERIQDMNFGLQQEIHLVRHGGAAREHMAKVMQYEITLREAMLSTETPEYLADAYDRTLAMVEKAERLRDIGESVGEAWGRTFEDMILGAQTAGQAFQSLGMEMARIALRQMITRPMEEAFGDLFASFVKFTPGTAGKIAPDLPASAGRIVPDVGPTTTTMVAHSGGTVGHIMRSRIVPASLFADAPRAHKGMTLGAGERPVIARVGETITPAGQSVAPKIAVNVTNQSGASVAAEDVSADVDMEGMVVNLVLKNIHQGGRLRRGVVGM